MSTPVDSAEGWAIVADGHDDFKGDWDVWTILSLVGLVGLVLLVGLLFVPAEWFL